MTRALRRFNFLGAATVVLLFVVWQIAVDNGLVTAQFIVAPTEIAAAADDLAASGELAETTAHTLSVVLIGWLICMVAGVALGCTIGIWRTPRVLTVDSIDFLRSLPPVAFVPVSILVFGFSSTMEIAVVVVGGTWAAAINTAGGIARVPRELYEVAQTFRLSRLRLIRDILLPAALPAILVGARLAMAIALILAVVAEMVGNPAGMGREIILSQQSLQPAQMYVYIIAIGLLGLLLNGTLELASRISPWSAREARAA